MSRLDDWLKLIDQPATRLDGTHPVDDPLATLLVQLAFSDGVVQEDELSFFRRVSPASRVLPWVEARAVKPVDLDALASFADSEVERHKLIGLAVRVVGLDTAVATEEVVHLHRLADHLGLAHDVIHEALAEVVAAGGRVAPVWVEAVVGAMTWRWLRKVAGDAEALAVLGRADAPEVAVYRDGLWAEFDGGEARVPFEDIVAYTRLPVRGRAFHVRTDRADHTFADPAFQDLGILLDRLYSRNG